MFHDVQMGAGAPARMMKSRFLQCLLRGLAPAVLLGLTTRFQPVLLMASGNGVSQAERTQAAIEAAIAAQRTNTAGGRRRVVLRTGRYLIDSPLVITPADSGLILESAPGERAELCGGRLIEGWKREQGGPLWVAQLPELKLKPWRFRMLLVNGKIAERARLPRDGFFADENPDYLVAPASSGVPPTDESLTTLKYKPGTFAPSLGVKSAEIRVYRVWDESLSKVSGIDDATRTVHLTTPLRFPPGAYRVHKYEVLNVREGLKGPGQWFLDYDANKLYYWPRGGERMESAKVWAPVTDTLIQIVGSGSGPTQGVTLRNIDFTLTDVPATSSGFAGSGYPGVINVAKSGSVLFDRLRFRDVGGSAIKIESSNGVRVLGSEFSGTGATAIVATESHDTEISDCRISSAGHSTPTAAGMLVTGDRAHIHHNEVHDMPYSGIAFNSGLTPIIEFNRVNHVMLVMADGSSFYVAGKGGILRNNWAYDVGVGPDSQAPAYYLDDKTTEYTVTQNVATVASWTLFVHNARANTVRDNFFISSGDQRVMFQLSKDTVLEHNLFWSGGSIGFEAAADAISAFDKNILYSTSGTLSLIQLDQAGKRVALDTTGNTVGDPGLVDALRQNLQFRRDSLAVSSGMKQPPKVSEIGPRVAVIANPMATW
jgi:hypothetical protein